MIQLKNTPNYAGVYVTGDWHDFNELYDALHFVVGEEWEYAGFEQVRLRVLGVCYDLRHAMMGGRGARFVSNGLDRDKMRFLSIAGTESNIYLQFEVLWPELLFVSFSLNEFIDKTTQTKKLHAWDPTIAAVRKFQSAVAACLEETLPESKFKNCKRYFKPRLYDSFYRYTTQYLDELNIQFIEMDRDKRLANISIMVKRINEKNNRYYKLKEDVEASAKHHGVSTDMIKIKDEYPEKIHW
ncbi:hypothetical protein [Sporosarcina sp. HYO08]|uniref:DUF6904 family protein n=1 Tax=Sporosarcina sp. HYO08 TaxID=1759557 RepID=UPI00079A2442|nr:hypothetical protein [Sporosarcina sp. HYO08]KXH86106.1 hypothetical protein AU377_14665 [Sporosarcina sp. HYO08]